MRRWRITIIGGLVLGLMFTATVSAWAASGVPLVSGSVIRDFARISFNWPQDTRIRAKVEGNRLFVNFDRPAAPDFGRVLSSLYPYVRQASVAGDGKTVIFTMDKGYPIRTFLSGNTIGVDILEIDPEKARKAPPAQALNNSNSTAPQKENALNTARSPFQLAPRPVTKPASNALAGVTPPAAPVPSESPATVQPAANSQVVATPPANQPTAATAPTEAATAAPINVPEKTDSRPANSPSVPPQNTASEKEQPVIATANPPQTSPVTEAATPAAETETASSGKAEALTVEAARTANGINLRFPWKQRVALAAFTRGNVVWMMFSQPATMNVSAITNLKTDSAASQSASGANTTSNPLIRRVEQFTTPEGYSVVRLHTDAPLFASVSQEEGKLAWDVALSSRSTFPAKPVEVFANNPLPPFKPHLFLPILQAANPVRIEDPEIGDTLMVQPFYSPGNGVFPERKFVEVRLLQTAQGLAVIPFNENAKVMRLRNGVRISTPEGMALSKDLPQISLEDYGFIKDAETGTFFPYDQWKIEKPAEFDEIRQELQRKTQETDPDRLNAARLKMARFYLAQGMGAEAAGLLDLIYSTSPQFYNDRKLYALQGAANFLMTRYGDAEWFFKNALLNDDEEITMWRNALGELLGNPTAFFNYMKNYDKYIRKYPPMMRQKLAILAADQAINRRSYNTALKVFSTLKDNEGMAPMQDYIDYLVGKVSADTGKVKEAILKWEELAKKYDDPFIRARAEYALIALQLREGIINRDEAIERLDQLRIVWRGDALELSVLNALARLYNDKEDYANALRIWQEIMNFFPNEVDATQIATKMADTFNYLYNEGGADKMPPLDALALYYEFRQLTPIGEKGDRMIRNLADRLVGVDLLDKAAALLQHQVYNRLQGEEKSRVGARLALVHLFNREPEKALRVLEDTKYPGNPSRLMRQRNQLKSKALLDLGRHEDALTLIDDDESREADLLRLNIYWSKRDWPYVIDLIENRLAQQIDPTRINNDDAGQLLMLALAYTFEGDQEQLSFLNSTYREGMKKSPYADSFNFLTNVTGAIDPKNFERVTQEITNVQSFMSNFRDKLKSGNKLSDVVQ
jgi:tetratricopeptide (TPR) repeat protein